MVVDANQNHGQRVDIFIYMDTGYIVRVHPGHHANGSNDMRPIVIPPRSPLLRNVDMAHGAGWAMHSPHPPASSVRRTRRRWARPLLPRETRTSSWTRTTPRTPRSSWTRTTPGRLGKASARSWTRTTPRSSPPTTSAMRHTLEGVFPQRDRDREADISFDERGPW